MIIANKRLDRNTVPIKGIYSILLLTIDKEVLYMQLNNDNTVLNTGGSKNSSVTYMIGKGEYRVNRTFGNKLLKDIMLEKISSESNVDIVKNPCYTDVES